MRGRSVRHPPQRGFFARSAALQLELLDVSKVPVRPMALSFRASRVAGLGRSHPEVRIFGRSPPRARPSSNYRPVRPLFANLAPVRSLTPVEAALCVAVAGSVLAVGVPAFVRDLHASRLVEPIDGLNRIAAAAAGVVKGGKAYPESVPSTPREVPSGAPAQDPPGTWDHPTWVQLGLSFSRPHSYSFEFESERRGRRSKYTAVARGDLDGDGQLSEFSVRGEAVDGQAPVTLPLEMRREVE
jgi:hypothetical protein